MRLMRDWGRIRSALTSAKLVTAILTVAIAASSALALHRETPGGVRITVGPPHRVPTGRSWDRFIAFSSTHDFLGTGTTGRQIFVYDHLNWVCQNGKPAATTICPQPPQPFLRQITNGPGNPDNPSVAAIDNIGHQWIAFDADGVFLNGGSGPEAHRRQIFLMDITTQEVRQITFAGGGDSVNPTLASFGGLLAFESNATIAGLPSSPGVTQIYAYEKQVFVMRKITHGFADSTNPMINNAGGIITFQSSSDLLGDGHDTGV